MIICMQCGHQNEGRDLKRCQSCGAILPRLDTSAMVKVEVQSGRVKQFSDAVEKVRSGEWGPEEFWNNFLQPTYNKLSSLREEIEDMITETNYQEQSHEEVEQGLKGMDCFEAGMQEMVAYVEEGEISYLDSGMEKIIEGNNYLNDAKRINREGRKELEEQWGTI
ncbi:MAG: hypothetical protein K6A35_01350 [bacterium]|nr:hypothetical protein [bacterium]